MTINETRIQVMRLIKNLSPNDRMKIAQEIVGLKPPASPAPGPSVPRPYPRGYNQYDRTCPLIIGNRVPRKAGQ
jgi:hypothetical protein